MLLHADGYDHYGLDLGRAATEAILPSDGYGGCVRYNIVSAYNGIVPPNGIGMLQCIGYQSSLTRPITSALKQSSQFRICWPDGLPDIASQGWGLSLLNSGGADFLKFAFQTNGSIVIANSVTINAGTTLGATAPGVVRSRTWQHFEFVYTPNTGAGTIPSPFNGVAEIWQEGVLILRVTGLSIGTTPAWHFLGWNAIVGNSPQCLIKDWIIADASGTDNNVIPLGPRRTSTRIATGNGPNNNWVPNGAVTNWQAIAKNSPDASSFSQGNNVGDIQDFTIPASAVTVYGVAGVLVKANASKSTAGTAAFKLGVESGGTTLNSADLIPGTGSFVYYNSQFIERDPNTGLPWTKAAYDAIGLRMTRSA